MQSFVGESFEDGCGWDRTVAGTVRFRIGTEVFVFDNPSHLDEIVRMASRARYSLDVAHNACRGCHQLVSVNQGICEACADLIAGVDRSAA